MGVGCDGCFAQIPEIEDRLAGMGVTLVSFMVQPPGQVAVTATRFGIEGPILIDEDRSVSASYDMLGIYGHSDRPSHSFALVGRDGTIKWVKHYATMFVPVDEFVADLSA
jgi:peroxiredoxin